MPRLAPAPDDRIAPALLTSTTLATGTLWGASATFVSMAARALRVIVVAPYVSVHDYGLLAASVALLEGLNAFSELGTQPSLVRHPGGVAHLLDTAFTVQAVKGLALAALLIAAAPLTATWVHDEALVPVVRVMALVPLIGGFANPAMAVLARRLEFSTLFRWGLLEPLITLVIGVWLAATLRSVWALALTAVCGEFVRVTVSYRAARYRPRVSFRRADVTELVQFGRWVFGSRILMFLSLRGDDLFVATVLGTTAAGAYSVAFRFAELPVLLVTHALVGAALPFWSGLSARPHHLRSSFLRTCLAAAVVNGTVAVAMLVVAPHVLPLPSGMTWEASRPLVLILIFASFGRSLIVLAEPYCYSVGRPAVWFWMNVCRVSGTAVLILPLTRAFGLVGVALAVTGGLFSTLPIAVRLMKRP